jgi:hypothetical protein
VQIEIEHRLFSFITIDRRGRPLTWYPVMVLLIAKTTTKKSIKTKAVLREGYYLTGIKITDEKLVDWPLTRHQLYWDWNFTVHPAPLK